MQRNAFQRIEIAERPCPTRQNVSVGLTYRWFRYFAWGCFRLFWWEVLRPRPAGLRESAFVRFEQHADAPLAPCPPHQRCSRDDSRASSWCMTRAAMHTTTMMQVEKAAACDRVR